MSSSIDLPKASLRTVVVPSVIVAIATALLGAYWGVSALNLGAFLGSLVLTVGALLAAGASSAWWSSKAVTEDVYDVATRVLAMTVENGETTAPIAVRNTDELGELAHHFEILRGHFLDTLQRLRQARREAEDADQYKTEFLTAVRHELRTPLNSILGFTEVLLGEIDGELNDGQREDLRMIQAAGMHLMALFNDVLDLSAAALGKLTLEWSETPVKPLLEEVAAELRTQIAGRNIEVKVTVEDSNLVISADRRRLRQVITNLGTNALKFTEHGVVELSATATPYEVRLQVRDSGVGIASADLPLIFEEFVQGADENQRRRGHGLGLAISKRLVELHRGVLMVESQVGRGSTFTISLPTEGPRSDAERPSTNA